MVVPGTDYQLAVPELDSPVIELLNSTVSQEFARVTPSTDQFSVAYQPRPDAEWETVAETTSVQEAIKKAACVQEFDIETVEDSRTGLEQTYLRPGIGGGIAVRSRNYFPIHLTQTATESHRTADEVLIEAPDEQDRAVFGKPAFAVKTRTSRSEQWRTIHAVHELASPSKVLAVLNNITSVDVWTPDTPSPLREFVEKSASPSSA